MITRTKMPSPGSYHTGRFTKVPGSGKGPFVRVAARAALTCFAPGLSRSS